MKNILFCLLSLCCVFTFAQNGITFEVEKLSKPQMLLPINSCEEIYKELILSDAGLAPYQIKDQKVDFPFNIVAKSESPDSLVFYSYHPFFNGMYEAYASHRPFVLSPDMIWLLISQGFARHVNANHESLRNRFVDFSGKLSLVVSADKKLEDPTFSWEELFPEFAGQIKKNVGNKLVDLLTCDFSTTTSLEKTVSEITIMETMKPYFEFIVIFIGCGIPEITLEGTPEDWQKVLDKAKGLKEYKLEWWISELEPLLEEFVKASKGKINKKFWQEMFKYHSPKKYGAPNIVDGWIVKFFPYDKKGNRNGLRQLEGGKSLPEEIVKVDLKFQEVYNDTIKDIPLELWAGFIGLKQNRDDFTLRPQIGWMIRKKDVKNEGLMGKLRIDAEREGFGAGISLRVKEFPSFLLELKEIKILSLVFTDDIDIPDELAKVKIKTLELSGRITKEEIERLKNLFRNTQLTINGVEINWQRTILLKLK